MKNLLLLALISVTTYYYAQQTSETIIINGVQREYIQYLPTNFDPTTENVPTVIVLHGLGSTNTIMTQAGFNQIADSARLVAIYPQGLNNAFGQAAWNNGTGASSTADDIAFMEQLMDLTINNYNCDSTRQYVTGFSMGSIMSYHLACNLNDRVAAIGAMAGTMSTSDINTCNPAYSTPVIHFHGTADPTVPYDANALPTLSLVPETIDFWKNQKMCSNTKDSIRIADIASDGLTTDRFIYNGCVADSSLELWRINGGGHDYYFQPVNDFTHALEVWYFLRKWQHTGMDNSAGLNNEEHENFSIFPNPSCEKITINSSLSNVQRTIIYSQNGNVIKEYSGSISEIDVSAFSNGVYFLKLATNHTVSTQKFVVQH